jgi:class 3 adenylate cyclase
MVPTFFKAPGKWLSHCSVVLAVLRVSWLSFIIFISHIWPAKQWLLVFPPVFGMMVMTTHLLVPMTFRNFAVTYFLIIGQGLYCFWLAKGIVTTDLYIRFFISAICYWMINVWNEDARRRRWRLSRVFRAEMIHLRSILQDLLPLDLGEPEHLTEEERKLHSQISHLSNPGGILHKNSCQVRRAVVLQLDICGFTEWSQKIEAMDLAIVMHHLFSAFDTCVQRLDLFKMDTVGDAYIVAGWLSLPSSESALTMQQEHDEQAQKLCEHVLWLAGFMHDTLEALGAKSAHHISARIGIGVGNVVVGAFGSLQPRVHIRGDGMRVAEALEQTGSPNLVHVDDVFLDILQASGCNQCHLDVDTTEKVDVGRGKDGRFDSTKRFIPAGLRWRKRPTADQVCRES